MKSAVFAFVVALTLTTSAMAQQCPVAFRLSGSGIVNPWSKTTNTAWSKMLPIGWVDNGFHFYSQARSRGPAAGMDTPSDLEDEIRRQVADQPEGHPNRRQIVLNIANKAGQKLRVVYDYDGKKTSKCQLVTLTY